MIYKLKNKVYVLSECTKELIPSHVERVLAYWETDNTDVTLQSNMMKLSIDQHLALQITDENNELCLAVYTNRYKQAEHVVNGRMLYAKAKRFIAMFLDYYKNNLEIAKILFMPHHVPPIPYKFIVETHSIKQYHSRRTPLIVDLQIGKAVSFINKYFNMYNIERV